MFIYNKLVSFLFQQIYKFINFNKFITFNFYKFRLIFLAKFFLCKRTLVNCSNLYSLGTRSVFPEVWKLKLLSSCFWNMSKGRIRIYYYQTIRRLKNGQTHFKNLAAFAARFLKWVWPFWSRRIVWVCLTILWGLALKGLSLYCFIYRVTYL